MQRSMRCALVLGALLATSAAAQPTIVRGVDVFQTSTGSPTFVDFSTNPIPAGFFCAGSAPFTGRIAFKGVPLATAPARVAANGDTIVERLADGIFSGGSATIPVAVRALRLTGTSTLNIFCPGTGNTTWQVDTCLCGLQPSTKITVKVDQSCGCGHFNGNLQLNVCMTFKNLVTGAVAGPINKGVILNIVNMPWCPNPGPGEPVIAPFSVETKCNGQPDLPLRGTTNFYPGWDCGNLGVDCLTQYASLTRCHAGPSPDHQHCVNPICDRTR